MKNLFLCLIFMLLAAMGGAQPSIEWQRTYGGSNADIARCIRQTNDGGYIVAGITSSNNGDVFGNHGGLDFWVLKLNGTGGVQWKKTYGGSENEMPFAVKQTSDGGYVVAGYTKSINWDVSGNNGYFDAWVLKLNANGTILWQKCLGGSNWEEAWDIDQTTDGGYIVAGRSVSTDGDVTVNHGSFDYWVVKLDSLGALLWQKSYGGSHEDIGYAVKQTTDGGYIVVGESFSTDGLVIGNQGSVDYWVLKLDHEGKIEWQRSLGGTNWDRANDVLQARDGGYVVFGYSYSSDGDLTQNNGNNDFWVVKLNTQGDIEWQNSFGGSNNDNGRSIAQTNDGGYVMTGQTQSNDGDAVGNDGGADLWVVRINEHGELLWQRSYGGSMAETGHSIQQTNDGGYIVAGYAWSTDGDLTENKGSADFWVVKLYPEETSAANEPGTRPLNIYPNPAGSYTTLSVAESADAQLTLSVCDLLGRELSRQTLTNGGRANLGHLPAGLYLLTAWTDAGRAYSGKLIKKE